MQPCSTSSGNHHGRTTVYKALPCAEGTGGTSQETHPKISLDQNLIRKSQSKNGSPVVLVEKPDKKLRLCYQKLRFYYQKLNALCKRRMLPLPNPDQLLAKIGENQPNWFSSTDQAAAFHQVAIHEDDKHKTAFALPWALFEWHVLPTELASSPICFA